MHGAVSAATSVFVTMTTALIIIIIRELQKTAILGTAHILRKVLT
jgi:hypothetical protein